MIIYFETKKVTDSILATTPLVEVNAAAVALENYSIVFDTTMFPHTGRILRKQVEKELKKPIKFVIISHFHGDHSFGAKAFKDIPIISSQTYLNNINTTSSLEWTPEMFIEWKEQEPEKSSLIDEIEIIKPTVVFPESSLILKDENDLTVHLHQTGGHTNDSLFAWIPSEKTIFSGDLMTNEHPFASDPTCDPDHWITGLKEILTYDFEHLVPGHGPVIHGKEEVLEFLDFLELFKTRTIEIIDQGLNFKNINLPNTYQPENKYVIADNKRYWYDWYQRKMKHWLR